MWVDDLSQCRGLLMSGSCSHSISRLINGGALGEVK